jgi:hypothetical protein
LKHEASASAAKQAEYLKTDSARILNNIFRVRLGKVLKSINLLYILRVSVEIGVRRSISTSSYSSGFRQHYPTSTVGSFFPKPRKCFYNFKKSDLVTIYTTLNFKSWDELYNTSDVDHACDVFYRDLKYVIDSFVPMAPANSNVFPKRYSTELISIIN